MQEAMRTTAAGTMEKNILSNLIVKSKSPRHPRTTGPKDSSSGQSEKPIMPTQACTLPCISSRASLYFIRIRGGLPDSSTENSVHSGHIHDSSGCYR